ncbi:STAS domain-containing protein [Streptomyces sp. NPDC059695]|uniref:STAS domain-containing protein n=1 Tax=Streptomyces sp. NPDC059695 TaxID=3346910 RepID=UPI0036AAE844
MPAQPAFTVSCRPAPPGTVVIALRGSADMDTAPVLARALQESLGASYVPEVLVVDCAGLEFCDSTGLNELLTGRMAAIEGGSAFRLAAPSRQAVRLLEITGTDTLFDVLPAAPILRGARLGGHPPLS